MFIGHYAVSLALKPKSNKVSLGILFIAVQFVDLLFFPMALAGIEKFNLIENYTDSTHFHLEYMPYTHSLIATFLWAIVIYLFVSKTVYKDSINKRNALIIAIAVLSHWFLDLIVHTPDLPLSTDSSYKMGLGLWNNAYMTYLLEATLLIIGLIIYMKYSSGKTRLAKYGMPVFVVILMLLNTFNLFAPLSPEETISSAAISAMIAYIVFGIIAHWLDKKRLHS